MDAADFEALGLYQPDAEHAEMRLELLKYLTDLGATAEELLAYRDLLPGLAMVLAVRGGPALSVEEAAGKAGVSAEEFRRLIRVTGFPQPAPGVKVVGEGFVSVASLLTAAGAVFGEETVYQLARVIGASMARIADAVVSAFLVNVEPVARREDPVGLGIARANVEAAELLPMVPPMLDALLRQHLIVAQRAAALDEDPVGYETQRLVVGFVDLVGSTELAAQVSMRELGAALTAFEHVASDTVTSGGGRVVKLIGDEIMYTAPEVGAACRIALDLSKAFAGHPVVPAVRAGLAMGQVMLRDGDAFGPVVNLAARAVKVAQPDEVIATAEVAAASGLDSEPLGLHRLKGIGEEVELRRLLRSPASNS